MSDCSSYSRSDSYGRDYDEEIPSTSIQDILDTFADLDQEVRDDMKSQMETHLKLINERKKEKEERKLFRNKYKLMNK